MNAFARIWRSALVELSLALKSRRMLVTVLLFSAITGLAMYFTIGFFAALETELLKLLALPDAGETGSVTVTLWQSEQFKRMIHHMTQSNVVFADIVGRHPIVLAYAFIVFTFVPLITLMTSSSAVANDIRSGSVRYMLTRVTRAEWSLGKFLGEAFVILVAMGIGSLVAWGVAIYRLPGWSAVKLIGDIFDWTMRAWIYSFAYLGIFMGISHLVRTPGKGTALALLFLFALGVIVYFFPYLDYLTPASAQALLWRRDFAAFTQGVIHLAALAFLYLGLGAYVFSRRDV